MGQPKRYRLPGHRRGQFASGQVNPGHRGTQALRQHHDLVADRDLPGRDQPGVATVFGVAGVDCRGLRPQGQLDAEPQSDPGRRRGDLDVFEQFQQTRAVVPGGAVRPCHDVVAAQGRYRQRGDLGRSQPFGHFADLGGHPPIGGLVVVQQVDLVHRDDHLRHPQQGCDGEVAAGLLEHALAYVHQQHQHVGGGRAGDGVAGVLHMAGAVREHEAAFRSGEVAVGDVDGDALLALGSQAVGEQGEIDIGQATVLADSFHGGQLVGQDRLGVVQQPPDQGRLAIVHTSGGGHSQQRAGGDWGAHQK